MNIHVQAIIFVVSEKKAFENFPMGPVNLCIVVAISDRHKKHKICSLPMIIPGHLVSTVLVVSRRRGSNVKLSPAVAAILNISEQKT